MTKPFTKAQRVALHGLWARNGQGLSYIAFRRKAYNSSLLGCVMAPWCGMMVGIERDGYTHS